MKKAIIDTLKEWGFSQSIDNGECREYTDMDENPEQFEEFANEVLQQVSDEGTLKRLIELEKYFDEYEPIDSEENEHRWKELLELRKEYGITNKPC